MIEFPTPKTQTRTFLARFLVVIFILMPMVVSTSGCNLLQDWKGGDLSDVDPLNPVDPLKPKPDPGPIPDQKFPESEYFEAMAQLVEVGRFTNTDQICLAVKAEQSLDHLTDIGRMAEFEAKRQDVTPENRKGIADKLRGK